MPSAHHFGSHRDDRNDRHDKADPIENPDPGCPPERVDEKSEAADYPFSYDDEEPLSLAEEIAAGAERLPDDIHDRYEQIKQTGDTHIAALQKMSKERP